MRISVILIFNLIIMLMLGFLRPEFRKTWLKWGVIAALLAAAMLVEFQWAMGAHVLLHLSSCLLLGLAILLWRRGEGLCVLVSAVLAGVVAWKVADLYPLFWGIVPAQALIALLFAMIYCKESGARLLSITLAPMVSGFCFMFSDYFLFRYLFLHIGGREVMDVQILSAFLFALLWRARGLNPLHIFRKKVGLNQP
ncbi:MAG: hypothetical protein FWE69_07535 [Clostridiales bacterium]|nr:hypothetical protein [Clostridiales bacterium]